MKNMINEILERVKNRSTNCLKNADVPDVSKVLMCAHVCKGSEWILTEKDGIETAVPCKCREPCDHVCGGCVCGYPGEHSGEWNLKTFRMDVYRERDSRKKGVGWPAGS